MKTCCEVNFRLDVGYEDPNNCCIHTLSKPNHHFRLQVKLVLGNHSNFKSFLKMKPEIQFLLLIFQAIFSVCFTNEILDDKEWVVMVTVSEWYDEMFQNWWLWYKRLDLKMETIVIAEDSKIYEKYQNQSDFKVLQFKIDEASKFSETKLSALIVYIYYVTIFSIPILGFSFPNFLGLYID